MGRVPNELHRLAAQSMKRRLRLAEGAVRAARAAPQKRALNPLERHRAIDRDQDLDGNRPERGRERARTLGVPPHEAATRAQHRLFLAKRKRAGARGRVESKVQFG